MAGALAQAAPPTQAPDPYDSQDRNLPPGWSRPLLDKATEALLTDLTERAPYEAQAAAMFSQAPRGSLPGALGAGMQANLGARLNMLQLPFQLRRQAADTRLQTEQAQRAGLENDMTRRNFGYLTEPWQVDEFSHAPGEQDVTRPPAGGGAPPAAGAPAQATPVAGGADGERGAGGARQPGPVDQFSNPEGLPLTPESETRLGFLGAQLERAKKYANRSPLARQDLGALLEEMTKTVQNDPLAKNELQRRQTQETSNVGVEADLKKRVMEVVQKSQEQADSEFNALASNPHSGIDPENPQAASAWVDFRARQIAKQQLDMLRPVITKLGFNPDEYLGQVAQEAAAQGQQPAPQQAQVPTLPDGTPLTDDAGAPAQLPKVGPSSDVPPPSPFKRSLLPQERIALVQEQEKASAALQTLEQAYRDLNKAAALNPNSSEGPTAEYETLGRRGVSAVQHLFGGKDTDPVLANTTELQAILSGQTLQNLSTLIKGNPTEGERAYTERLGALVTMTRGERERLIKRGLQLVKPRLEFAQLYMDSLAKGQPLDPTKYKDWVYRNYGEGAEEILKPIVPAKTGGQ